MDDFFDDKDLDNDNDNDNENENKNETMKSSGKMFMFNEDDEIEYDNNLNEDDKKDNDNDNENENYNENFNDNEMENDNDNLNENNNDEDKQNGSDKDKTSIEEQNKQKETAKKKKLEQQEEIKKMQVLMANFSEEQLNRYEIYRRSAFPKANIKRIIQTVCGKTITHNIVIAMSGIAKVFVGEIVELALDAKQRWNDSGPLQPKHLREAYRLFKKSNKLSSPIKHRKQSLLS